MREHYCDTSDEKEVVVLWKKGYPHFHNVGCNVVNNEDVQTFTDFVEESYSMLKERE